VLIYADENNGVVIPEVHNSHEVENLDKAPEGTYYNTYTKPNHLTKRITMYFIFTYRLER
jgi:hypothetical protein